jgi:hypothetical protein
MRIKVFLPIALLVAGCLSLWRPSSVYRTYVSPTGDYKLVVHTYLRLLSAPGDTSGAPGYIELFDRNGKKLAATDIPIVIDVSTADNIHWSPTNVMVPGLFDFPLQKP